MTIPVSTTTAVRAYLFQALTAAMTPDMFDKSASLLVCYDEPGPDQPEDIVTVGKVARQLGVSSLVGSGGAGWLDEQYTVEIQVEVYRGGDDPQAAYARCADLVDVAISVVRSDPTLGGAVIVARPISHTQEVMWDDAHSGRVASAAVEIQCRQRI
jgi:hypothetical protein